MVARMLKEYFYRNKGCIIVAEAGAKIKIGRHKFTQSSHVLGAPPVAERRGRKPRHTAKAGEVLEFARDPRIKNKRGFPADPKNPLRGRKR